jgi:hypothetical protein
VTAEIDEGTGMLATPACPKVRSQVFISGTQPVEVCRLHGGARTQIAGWEPTATTPAPTTVSDRPPTLAANPQTSAPKTERSIPVVPAPAEEQPKEKKPHKGFFGRLRDVFK